MWGSKALNILGVLRAGLGSNKIGHKINNGVLRAVFDVLSDSVSAKDFGVVGDGITNDTAALSAAMQSGLTINFNNEVVLTDSQNVINDYRFKGKATIKLIDNSASHLFILTNKKIVFDGDFILDGNKINQSMSANLGPDLISAQSIIVSIGRLTLKNGARYGIKTNTGASGSSFQHIHVDDMGNTGILLENTNDSDIMKITGGKNNLGHLLNIINDSKGNNIGNVSGYTAAVNRFIVELLTNNDKNTAPRNNIIGDIYVDGQNVGGGVSLSGVHNNVIGNITAVDCPSIACIEFAQGASDNFVSSLVAENCNRVAITGTSAKKVQRNMIGFVNLLFPINASIGVYFYESVDCFIGSLLVSGVSLNHSIRMQNAIQCKVSDFILKGNNTALEGVLMDGSTRLCMIRDGVIEDHTTINRYALKDTTNNINFFESLNCRNNNNLMSVGNNTQFKNIKNNDNDNVGTLALTAGSQTVVSNANITSKSKITLIALDASAASITSIYVSGRSTAVNFTISHSLAVGGELFDYVIN